jgi:multimeric flavodoxin WrbA
MVKILGLSGSPRKGATEYTVEQALKAASKIEGIETELITLRGKKIAPCNGCGYCRENNTWCVIKDDMHELLTKFVEADAYIIASPVYVYTVTPQLQAFFSRMRPCHHVFPNKLRNKLGAAIAVGGTRNGGQEMTINTIINLMLTRSINVVSNEVGGYAGGKIWSQDKKDLGVKEDLIGLDTVINVSKKLAETALIYDAGKKVLEAKTIKVPC